ncbi:MAG TPA: hypothetical protein VFE65_34650 [Pseudonocardia sp.]|jgi:hypothetical protein|nr:hypothetical protein [Pseudonocardia sp.]
MPAEPAVNTEERISYAEFGAGFFEHAITKERVLGSLGDLAGDAINFGPIRVGPGGLAQVRANGQIGQPSAVRLQRDEVAFLLSIPVELDLQIHLLGEKHKFHASIGVTLTLTARATRPLCIFIDINEPQTRDVVVSIEADGLRASVLRHVAGIDRELAQFVARYVGREIDKPSVRAARMIDVAAKIDGAYPAATHSPGTE